MLITASHQTPAAAACCAGTLFTMARLINENVPGFIDDKAR
jgi:hypothetical protein